MSYTKEKSLSGANSTQQTIPKPGIKNFNPKRVAKILKGAVKTCFKSEAQVEQEVRSMFTDAAKLGWQKVQAYIEANPPRFSPEEQAFIDNARKKQ